MTDRSSLYMLVESSLVAHRLDRVVQRGANILRVDSIACAHLFDGHSARETSNKRPYRHARAPDDRLTTDDAKRSFDAFTPFHATNLPEGEERRQT